MVESERSRDARAISVLYESWFDAMERGDVSGLLELLSPDVVLKMPGAPPMVGKQPVAEALRAFHDSFTEVVSHHVEEIEVSGDLAFARVSEEAHIRSRSDDNVTTVSGMHLAILRRQPDGSWLVARDVASLNGGP